MGNYVVCPVCHGNCDTGELVNGKCLECIEEERKADVKQDMSVKLLNAPFEQMELDFGGIRI